MARSKTESVTSSRALRIDRGELAHRLPRRHSLTGITHRRGMLEMIGTGGGARGYVMRECGTMKTVALYTAQIHAPALRKWAACMPRELGASIIAEAAQDLLAGDCGGMKSLLFISRLNARRRHRRRNQPD